MRYLIFATFADLGVSACAGTQELQIAPNMVRLDVGPSVAPFIRESTLKRAAELTLQNGYSAFRLTPIYMLTFDHFGVTVDMLHAGDPGANEAFDAVKVLKQSQ